MTSAFTKTVVSFFFPFFGSFWVEKQNLQQREMRGIFPVGFATAHLEVIREPGRPVSQAGALLAGQDELLERGSSWSLSVSLPAPLPLFSTLSLSFFLSLSHTSPWQNWKLITCRRQRVYHGDGRWTSWTRLEEKRRMFCPLFLFAYTSIYLIYLFNFPSGSRLPADWGIRHMSVVCEGLCMCLRWAGSAWLGQWNTRM